MDYELAATIVQIGLLIVVIKIQFELSSRITETLLRFRALVEKIEGLTYDGAAGGEPPTYIQQVLGNFLMSKMQQHNDLTPAAAELIRDGSGKFSKE